MGIFLAGFLFVSTGLAYSAFWWKLGLIRKIRADQKKIDHCIIDINITILRGEEIKMEPLPVHKNTTNGAGALMVGKFGASPKNTFNCIENAGIEDID